MAPRLLFFLVTYPGIEVTSRFFWSNSVGLREISYFFHSCNGENLFPRVYGSQDIVVWRNFRKVRRSRCCVLVGGQVLRFFAELADLLRLAQALKK